jgi:HD-like signal output (HDOD) protein
MTPELQEQLQSCKTLPSPPGVATQIIDLANDPDADINKIAKILSMDPAITTKILRIANSPMYGQSRKMENLRQAVIVIGLNATISLALSFSLLKSWQDDNDEGSLDYPLYWRRALLAATVSGVLARAAKLRDSEELFLASLIQDIGMLALDRTLPKLYSELGDEQTYEKSITELEIKELGVDHATVGGWLLERWNFAERTQQAVAANMSALLNRDSGGCGIEKIATPMTDDTRSSLSVAVTDNSPPTSPLVSTAKRPNSNNSPRTSAIRAI